MSFRNIFIVEVGEVDVHPRTVKVTTTDSYAVITTPGYLNNIQGYQFAPTDIFEIIYAFNPSNATGTFQFFTISFSGNIMTLVPDISEGNVVLPVVVGNFPIFANSLGVIEDSGVNPASFAANVLTTKGDIYTYSTMANRQPVGADFTVLQADSSQVNGIGYTSVLGDTGGLASVDFFNRTLNFADASIAINYANGQVFDALANLSIDWVSRTLAATDGTTLMVDWSTVDHLLLGSAGNARVDIVGGSPGTTFFGTDGAATDIGMTFETKGAGSYEFTSGVTGLLSLTNQAAAVNNWGMYVATTGNAPILQVKGTDTNISMELQAKGTGTVFSNNPISAFAGLRVLEDVNSKQGIATLVAGTVSVANTSITANSRIFLTAQDNDSVGALRVSARVVGTSFDITSSVNTDTGVVAYEIFEPAV